MSTEKHVNTKCRSQVYRKWINSKLIQSRMLVTDLAEEISEGVKVVRLIEILSNESLPAAKRPKTEEDKIANINIAFDFLKNNSSANMSEIDTKNIISGNLDDILNFIWEIIEYYEVKQSNPEIQDSKQNLLAWCNETLAESYPSNIQDFRDSWRDGEAFCFIVCSRRPDLLNYNVLKGSGSLKTLSAVFDTCEKYFGIPKLFAPSDLIDGKIEDKEIMIYLSLIRSYFDLAGKSDVSSKLIVNKIMAAKKNLLNLEKFQSEMSSFLIQVKETQKTLTVTSMPNASASLQEKIFNFNKYLEEDKINLVEKMNRLMLSYYKLAEQFLSNRQILPSKSGYELVKELEKEWNVLESVEETFESKVRAALERVDKLEIKVTIYTKKVNNRLLWLTGTLKLATLIDVTNDHKTNSASLKKIEALEKEVRQNTDKIKSVNSLYMELEKDGYFDLKTLRFKKLQVQELWTKILAMLKNKRTQLEETNKTNIYDVEILKTWNSEMLQKIEIDTRGSNIKALEEIRTRYNLIQSEFLSYYEMVKKILITKRYIREGVTNEFTLTSDDITDVQFEIDRMKSIVKIKETNITNSICKLIWVEMAHSTEDFLCMFADVFCVAGLVSERKSVYSTDLESVTSSDLNALKALFSQYEYNLSEVKARKISWIEFDSTYTSEEYQTGSFSNVREIIHRNFDDILNSSISYLEALNELRSHSEILMQCSNVGNMLRGYQSMVKQKVYRSSQNSFEAIYQNIKLLIDDIGKTDLFLKQTEVMIMTYSNKYESDETSNLNNVFMSIKEIKDELVVKLMKKLYRYQTLRNLHIVENLLDTVDSQLRSKDRTILLALKVDMDDDPLKVRSMISSNIESIDSITISSNDIKDKIEKTENLLKSFATIKKDSVEAVRVRFVKLQDRFSKVTQSMTDSKSHLLNLLMISELFILFDEVFLTFNEDDNILSVIILQNESKVNASDQRKTSTIQKRFNKYTAIMDDNMSDYKKIKKLESAEVKYLKQRVKDCKKIRKIVEEKLKAAGILFLNITPQQQLDIFLKEFKLWLSSIRDMCSKIDTQGNMSLDEALNYLEVLSNYKAEFPDRRNDLMALQSQLKLNQAAQTVELDNSIQNSYEIILKSEMNLNLKISLLQFENLVAQLRANLQREKHMLDEPFKPESYVHYKLILEKWKACKEHIEVNNYILIEIQKNGDKVIKNFPQHSAHVNNVCTSIKEEFKKIGDEIKKRYLHVKRSELYFKFLKRYEKVIKYLEKFENESLLNEAKTLFNSMEDNCKQYIMYQTYLCSIDEFLMHIIKTRLFGYKAIKKCPWYEPDILERLSNLKVNYERRRNLIKSTIKELFESETDLKDFVTSSRHKLMEIKLFILFAEKYVNNYYSAYYGIKQCISFENILEGIRNLALMKRDSKLEKDHFDFMDDLEKISESLKLSSKILHHLMRNYVRINIIKSYNKHITDIVRKADGLELNSCKEGSVVRIGKIICYLICSMKQNKNYSKVIEGLFKDNLAFNYHIAENMAYPRRFDSEKQLYGRYSEESKNTVSLMRALSHKLNTSSTENLNLLSKMLYTSAIPMTKLKLLYTFADCQLSMLTLNLQEAFSKDTKLSTLELLSFADYSYNYMSFWSNLAENEKKRHNFSTAGTEWEVTENKIIQFKFHCDILKRNMIHSRCKRVYIDTITYRQSSKNKSLNKLKAFIEESTSEKGSNMISHYFPIYVGQSKKFNYDTNFLALLDDKAKELILQGKYSKLTSLRTDLLQYRVDFKNESEYIHKLFKIKQQLSSFGIVNEFCLCRMKDCDESLGILKSPNNNVMVRQLYNLKVRIALSRFCNIYEQICTFLNKNRKIFNDLNMGMRENLKFDVIKKQIDDTDFKLKVLRDLHNDLISNAGAAYMREKCRIELLLRKMMLLTCIKRVREINCSDNFAISVNTCIQIEQIKNTISNEGSTHKKFTTGNMNGLLPTAKNDVDNILAYTRVEIDRRQFNFDCHKKCFHNASELEKFNRSLKDHVQLLAKTSEDKFQTVTSEKVKSLLNNYFSVRMQFLFPTLGESSFKLQFLDNQNLFNTMLNSIKSNVNNENSLNLYEQHYDSINYCSTCQATVSSQNVRSAKAKKTYKFYYVLKRDMIRFYKTSNLDLIQDDFEGWLTFNVSLVDVEVTISDKHKGKFVYTIPTRSGSWIQLTIEKNEQNLFNDALKASSAIIKQV